MTAAVLAAAVPAPAQQLFGLTGPSLGLQPQWGGGCNIWYIERTADVVLGDVDGDGDVDVLAGRSGVGATSQGWWPYLSSPFLLAGRTRLYLNDGDGRFTDRTAGCMPPGAVVTSSLALGDVDGDGDLDLVVGVNGLDNSINYSSHFGSCLLLNDGAGNFSTPSPGLPLAIWANAVALADVDGDRDLDLVTACNGQNRLYLNDGTGTFTDATTARMPFDSDWSNALALGDVDGDGDLDLVIGNDAAQNCLYLNDGTGTFTDATDACMPIDGDLTNALALGDLDGDGDLDLVIGNRAAQNRLYLNDGTGTFLDATAARLPVGNDDPGRIHLVDVDGDGRLDIITHGDVDWLLLDDGNGFFRPAPDAMFACTESPFGVGDIDGDGDADLVGNNACFNLLRQLDAPAAVGVGQACQLGVYACYGPPRSLDLALVCISTGTAYLPVPGVGTLRLDPGLARTMPLLLVPQPSGVGRLSLAVPSDPRLVGLTLHSQALMIQPPLQPQLTNACHSAIL